MKSFIKRIIAKRIAKLTDILVKEYDGEVVTQDVDAGWKVAVNIGDKRRIILHSAEHGEMFEISMLVSWYIDIPFINTPSKSVSIATSRRVDGGHLVSNPLIG